MLNQKRRPPQPRASSSKPKARPFKTKIMFSLPKRKRASQNQQHILSSEPKAPSSMSPAVTASYAKQHAPRYSTVPVQPTFAPETNKIKSCLRMHGVGVVLNNSHYHSITSSRSRNRNPARTACNNSYSSQRCAVSYRTLGMSSPLAATSVATSTALGSDVNRSCQTSYSYSSSSAGKTKTCHGTYSSRTICAVEDTIDSHLPGVTRTHHVRQPNTNTSRDPLPLPPVDLQTRHVQPRYVPIH